MDGIICSDIFDRNKLKINSPPSSGLMVSSPVYDGIEPYYLFRRRINAYLQTLRYKSTHENILNLLNESMCTNYKCLLEIKKINKKKIPSCEKLLEIASRNSKYDVLIGIMKESEKNKINQSCQLINKLLNTIKFSLLEIPIGKETYCTIKSYIIIRVPTEIIGFQ